MTTIQRFYLTFGSQYSLAEHPTWKHAHPDGWVEVLAETEDQARSLVYAAFRSNWSNLYDEAGWDPSYFPKGRLGTLQIDLYDQTTLYRVRQAEVSRMNLIALLAGAQTSGTKDVVALATALEKNLPDTEAKMLVTVREALGDRWEPIDAARSLNARIHDLEISASLERENHRAVVADLQEQLRNAKDGSK